MNENLIIGLITLGIALPIIVLLIGFSFWFAYRFTKESNFDGQRPYD